MIIERHCRCQRVTQPVRHRSILSDESWSPEYGRALADLLFGLDRCTTLVEILNPDGSVYNSYDRDDFPAVTTAPVLQ